MRIRIRYQKNVDLKYTGHLDLSKIWERYLRRSKLPLAYSEGFHPQPKINQALPLPLGITSIAEIMDIWLETRISPDEVKSKLRSTTQPGIEVISVEEIELSSPKVQNLVSAAEYTVWLLDPYLKIEIEDKIKQLMVTDTIMREKRGKTYNLRPLILDIEISKVDESGENCFELQIQLQAKPGATGRPDEVLSALLIDPLQTRIERTKIVLEKSTIPVTLPGEALESEIQ